MCRTHATVRSLIGALVEAVAETTVADMEAGLEHLSRGTPRYVDTILTVVEPYFKSLETGRKICELARELGVPKVYVVANKVQGPLEGSAIRAFCERHGLDLVAVVPYDEAFVEADRVGRAPLDIAPDAPGIQEIVRIAERLSKKAGSGGGDRDGHGS
jgi:CO dehydrogenase maturation factor